MTEHHRIYLIHRHWKSQVLRLRFLALPLKEAAVEQNRLTASAHYVTGASDFASGAEELDFHAVASGQGNGRERLVWTS
jgi:hypothetical protein